MEAQKLLNYGFQYYETLKLYSGGRHGSRASGVERQREVAAGRLPRGLLRVGPEGPARAAQGQARKPAAADRPVSPQQPVGVLRLTFDDKPYGEFPVVALEPVGVANIFVRAWDSLRLLFQ